MPFFQDPFSPKANNQPPSEEKVSESTNELAERGVTDGADYGGGDAAGPTDAERSEPVPEGTVKEVMAWVGDDQDKARRALDAEKSSDDPRKGLLRQLEEKLGDD